MGHSPIMSNILVVSEGAVREKNYLEKCFKAIGKESPAIFSYCCNAYSLYNVLLKNYNDGVPVNLLDVLKECQTSTKQDLSILERPYTDIYLVFDLDYHAASTLEQAKTVFEYLLERFKESTEEGEIVIDYPMVESFRDISNKTMKYDKEHLEIKVSESANYKCLSASRGINISALTSKKDFECLIFDHIKRVFLLLNENDESYFSFLKCTQSRIFAAAQNKIENAKIPVLCSILLIPVLYYGKSFFEECRMAYSHHCSL